MGTAGEPELEAARGEGCPGTLLGGGEVPQGPWGRCWVEREVLQGLGCAL